MRALVLLLTARAALACPHDGKTLPVARGSIVVDGRLDDAVWQTACFIDDFEQRQPEFGKRPSHRIVAAVAIDGDTLYVGARMAADRRSDVDDALTQRDDTAQAERFIVSIDPSHTRRIAFSFAVTAAGVRADWIHTDDTMGARDPTWNPVWRAATQIAADGWTAELAMPLSQLRLPHDPATSWGINFNWYIPHSQEDVYWVAVPRDRTAWASWFGELTGLPPIAPRVGLEVMPYVATRAVVDEVRPAVPTPQYLAGFEAGVDIKAQPRAGLVVAATINPDFAQVDADPAFVNLTAYEVTLPEKRPFFVENAPLFADAPTSYFYSRRIGGLPLAQPTTTAIDLPPQVRILGAVAAGGFVAPETQIAALGAVTDETSASAVADGKREDLVVSPLTGWAVARLEHQVGASVLGATATAVERHLDGTGLAPLLAQTALVGASDFKLRSADGTYQAYLYGATTALIGDPAAITATEESSAHYFQRPDAKYLHLDTDARDMVGWQAVASGSKRSGEWQGNTFVSFESPRYELNDLGALQSADDIDVSADVRRVDITPGDHLFGWSVGAGGDTSWNFGGMQKQVDARMSGFLVTNDFNSAGLRLYYSTAGDSDDLTRGGPQMHVGWSSAAVLSASTPSGRARQLSGSVTIDESPTLLSGVVGSATLTGRITPALRLDLSPAVTWLETRRQYVDTVTDAGGGDATYGARYLFGHLHRKEASAQLRATWSLSPELVMTLYAQPFISVGHYDQLGELAAAGGDDVRWYPSTTHAVGTRIIDDGTTFSIVEPDYTVVSLRSTAVLRWEFRPGSTLFIVWQQARGGTTAPVAQPLHAVGSELITQPALHTLAIKLSYWFG